MIHDAMRKPVLAFLLLPLGALAYACSGDDDGGGGGGGGTDASVDVSNPTQDSGGTNDSGFNFDSGGGDGGAKDGGDGGARDGGDAGFPFPLLDAAVTPLVTATDPGDFSFLDGVTFFQNQVVFSDVFGSRWSVATDGGNLVTQNLAGFTNPIGNAVNADASALYTAFAGQNAVVRNAASFSTGPAGGFNQPNDLVVRSDGLVFLSDPFTYANQTNNGSVWSIPAAGGNPTVAQDFVNDDPNGIALSPDEKTLYVSVTNLHLIKKYTVAANGTLSGAANFADTTTGALPDGLAVDDAGNVYAAMGTCTGACNPANPAFTGAKVFVYNSAGTKIGEIAVPKYPAVSLAFGNADRKTLYIAAGNFNIAAANTPGIFQVRTAVPGKP